MRLLERSLHRNAQLYLAVVSEENTTWTTIAAEVVTFQEHLYLFFRCSELNKILDINTHNGSYDDGWMCECKQSRHSCRRFISIPDNSARRKCVCGGIAGSFSSRQVQLGARRFLLHCLDSVLWVRGFCVWNTVVLFLVHHASLPPDLFSYIICLASLL